MFKNRNFRYYWGGTLASVMGEHIENVVRNWLVWELTHSVFWMMVMVFMHWLPHALFSIPAGSIAEKVERQPFILWSEIGLCLAALGMFITTYGGVMNPYWMAAFLLVHSTAGSLSQPSRQLFLHDMVERENLLAGVAMTQSIRFGSMSIGKPVAGVILLSFGAAFGFFVNAVAFLPLILGLLTVIRVTQKNVPRRPERTVYGDLKEGLRHIKKAPPIRSTILLAAAPNIFIGSGFDPFLVIYADKVFSMGAAAYTYFIGAVGLGALAGIIALGWVGNIRWKGKMLLLSVFCYCGSMVAFAVSRSFAISLIALVLFGLFQVTHHSSATAVLLENVPSEMRGRVMGIFNFSRLGLRVVNGPFFALLSKLAVLSTATAFAGYALTLSFAALTVALLTLILTIATPGITKQE